MKTGISILVFALLSITVQAQLIIKGKITDEHTGSPLPEASITVVGSASGTTTNRKGHFEISIPNSPESLSISYVGYETQTIQIKASIEHLHIRLRPSNLQLNEVTVIGFDSNRKLIETAGAIAVLSEKEIRRSTNVSLAQSLNIIPGVRMEENGNGGTARVSIRGSLLRSPWGIRNIKVYWNDIPITDPAGTSSRFNAIDVESIGSIEVTKGPSASVYGAGTGGVINIVSSKAKFGETSFESGNTFGSNGLRRTAMFARHGGQRINVIASYVNQNLDGYREHQRSDKQVFNLASEFMLNEAHALSFHIFHYNGEFELPGSLSAAEVRSNRRDALEFNKANDCRLSNVSTGLVLSHHYQIRPSIENQTSVSAVINTMDHPWGSSAFYNGYSIGSSQGLYIRSRFTFNPEWKVVPTKITAGLEWQVSNEIEKEYQNNLGEPGTMQNDYEMKATQSIWFVQSEFVLPKAIIVTVGGSYNLTKYNFINRLGATSRLDSQFDPTFAPRVAVVKKINEDLSAHGSVSYGFSPPTQWEVQTQAGINPDLKAEHGTNYEAGFRGNLCNDVVSVDISAYTFKLNDAILPRYNEAQQEYFENTGSTRQQGIESTISLLPIRNSKRFSVFKTWISYTFNHYRFGNYKKQVIQDHETVTQDFSGNSITGVPRHLLNIGMNIESTAGIYSMVTWSYVDEIPLNDSNSKFAPRYSTFGGKAGYRKKINDFQVDMSIGFENLFNSQYNNFLSLNDANERYFNPAPGRNFFGALNLRYILNQQ